MAADANRLAAALAYEDERRRRLAETIPTLTGPTTQPRRSVRTDLENLSAGLGRGITTQLQGIKGLVTDPIGTAKGAYEAARAVVRDPSVLAAALTQMGQKAASGPLGAGEVIGEMVGPRKTGPVMAELDVYHGTPHRFPATEANPLGEFDASKIGTGEGAQAYGHGIYYAENPEIARGYQKDLSNYTQPFIQFKGQKIAGTSLSDLDIAAYKYLQTGQKDAGQFPHNTVYYAKKAVENAPDKYWTEKFSKEEILKRINEFGSDVKFGEEKNLGALYKADLPDEMIDRMLDWDKPLSEQPKAVQEITQRLRSLPGDPYNLERYFNPANPNKGPLGQEVYRAISEHFEKSDDAWRELGLTPFETQNINDAASRYASRLGIPGIKYLDAGSRGQGGSGTRNFVVFPGEEKKVRILERDGQKAPPQKIAQALETVPDYRMSHRPLKVGNGAAQLNKAYEVFGQDIYGPNALHYFGAGDPREAKTVAALKRLRDNPNAEVTIYRGVPADATGGITKGDWVTLDKDVAQDYADLKPGQKGKVLTMKVKAKDVTTWPDSLLEFGYYPSE